MKHLYPHCLSRRTASWLPLVALLLVLPWAAVAAETPRAGGELVFAVAETPPSFDGHRETTFAMIHPIAPHYSTLLRFDPHNYPKIVGDVAEKWSASKDGLTVTFKLRKGIKFHDGTALTAQDVKATYDKIIFPAEGVASARKASYAMVDKIEAPDDLTVVFKLKHIAASFLANLASPWNFHLQRRKVEKRSALVREKHSGLRALSFSASMSPARTGPARKIPTIICPAGPILTATGRSSFATPRRGWRRCAAAR